MGMPFDNIFRVDSLADDRQAVSRCPVAAPLVGAASFGCIERRPTAEAKRGSATQYRLPSVANVAWTGVSKRFRC
jgi:hypothetical protein